MNRLKSLITLIFCITISLTVANASSPIDYDQKKAAIDSLKNHEKKHGAPKFIAKKKIAIPEFGCDANSRFDCETQEVMHRIENRPEPVFIENGKYKVDVFFTNDRVFPHKYVEEKHFISISKQEETSVVNEIYQHYLGNEFASYSPKVINVNESTVGVSIFVKSGDELEVFLVDSRILGIYHIGNNLIVPEGY